MPSAARPEPATEPPPSPPKSASRYPNFLNRPDHDFRTRHPEQPRGEPQALDFQRSRTLAQRAAHHRDRMPGARPHGRGARQDSAAQQVHRRPRHAPAREHYRPHGDGQLARRSAARHPDRQHRPRHEPRARPEHRARRALGHRPYGAGDPRLLLQGRRARRLRAAHGAQKRHSAVPCPGLGARGRARARVLPRGQEHRPRPAATPAHRPLGPRRNLAPALQHRRRQRVRSAVRGHLRLLRCDGPRRRYLDP